MGILITGMHRSGTSTVASLTESLGLSLGPGRHIDPGVDNARGFLELEEVREFNDEWLRAMGGAWDAPPRAGTADFKLIDEHRIIAARSSLPHFDGEFSDWFIKDPRLSLILPLWDRLLLRLAPVIIVVRSPRQVALSLILRNQVSAVRALSLWAEHYRALLSSLGSRPTLVLDYDKVLADPDKAEELVAEFAGLAPTGRASERVVPGLKHNQSAPLNSIGERLVVELESAYEELSAAHGSAVPALAPSALALDWVNDSLDEANLTFHYRKYAEELAAEVERRRRRAFLGLKEPIVRRLSR